VCPRSNQTDGGGRGPTVAYTARQAPAVLDHSRALPQCDGSPRPAFAGGAEGGERDLVILDAGDVLDDAFPVSGPGIDAEGEVGSRCGHRHPPEGKIVEGGDCHE